MKVKDLMTPKVIDIDREESVAVAARALAHYNVGVLPVRNEAGQLCGVVTDRDIVTRCLAAGRTPENTKVGQIMTAQVHSVQPDIDTSVAAHIMGKQQVRRLPVVENGKLCGMISLGDLANREETNYDAADAFGEITSGISSR